MERPAGRSWRFATDWSRYLHAVLFLRDSASLADEDFDGEPPPLIGLHQEINVLDADDRLHAAQEWPDWWQAVVAAEARRNRPPRDADRLGPLETRVADLGRVIDPPEWTSLSERPALRLAARKLFADGCRWAEQHRADHVPPIKSQFHWEHVRDAAEAVTAELNVPAAALDG